MQTPYGPMYALMTSCEKQTKDVTAGDAYLLPSEQQTLGLGRGSLESRPWMGEIYGQCQRLWEEISQTIVPGRLCFVGMSVCISSDSV